MYNRIETMQAHKAVIDSQGVMGVSDSILRIIAQDGYLESIDNLHDVPAGAYRLEVENRTGKSSSLVLMSDQGKPLVMVIAKDGTTAMDVELKAGRYTYFCPLVPTPKYTMIVR